MESLAEQKKRLRSKVRAACEAIDPGVAALQDTAVLRRVLTLPEYVAADTLFVYVSLPGEVDTHEIVRRALSSGKRVAVPRCTAPGVMEIRAIEGLHELSEAAYGLLEPGEESLLLAPGDVDLALVPCAACDTRCNRLGKGGGYYDRVLQGRPFPAAALCREAALLPDVPREEWDQPVDMVVTEQRLLRRILY